MPWRSHPHLLIPVSLAVLLLGIAVLRQLDRQQSAGIGRGVGGDAEPPLVIYCASGLRPAVEPLSQLYIQDSGRQVILQYGPSGALEAQAQLSERGDLFIPAASDPYLSRARKSGLVTRMVPIAQMHLVIAWNASQDFGGETCQDLIVSDLSFGLANAQAAVGFHTKRALQAAQLWESATQEARVFLPTVNELAEAIRQGDQVQAGIVWDATAKQYGLQFIETPELSQTTQTVAIGILSSNQATDAANQFIDLALSKQGQAGIQQQFYSSPTP